MNNLKIFIEEKVKANGFSSMAEFARELNVQPQALVSQFSRNTINLKTAVKWAKVLKVSIDELAMHIDNDTLEEPAAQYGSANTTISAKQILRNVIELPYLSINHQNKFVMKNKQDITEITETHEVPKLEEIDFSNCIVFEVNDDQMEPTILKNSKILARLIQPEEWQNCQNKIYVVNYARAIGTFRIKTNTISENQTLVLFSDNPKYGEIKIPFDAIKNIFELIAVIWSVPK
jgi:phage repressor protein C with HTH and peptisase S24 domain